MFIANYEYTRNHVTTAAASNEYSRTCNRLVHFSIVENAPFRKGAVLGHDWGRTWKRDLGMIGAAAS
jgi:hypothetical protein